MKYNRILTAFFICILCLSLISCKKKYKDEDLIMRYVNENPSKFDNNKDFYLLVLRFFPMSCAATVYGYDADLVISKVKDSLNTDKLYILYDSDYIIINSKNNYPIGSFHYVKESHITLDDYAFPYTPHVFHIKNKSIKTWKEVYYKPKGKYNYFK